MGLRGKDAGLSRHSSETSSSQPKETRATSMKLNDVKRDSTKVSTVKKKGDSINKMSHTVTVTRTTTTTTTSAIILNTGYLKTIPGLLKVIEVIVAAVCLFLLAWYYSYASYSAFLFFFSIITTAVVASSCLLIACLISLSTASIIAKTIYELVFHVVLCVLTLISAILFFVDVDRYGRHYSSHTQYYTAAILGLVLGVLYLISTVYAYRSYRGL